MEFDHVLRIIGEFGPHQRRLYTVLNLSIIPAAFQLLLLVFTGAQPDWVCLDSPINETCPRNSSRCTNVQYTSKFTSIVTEWDLVCEDAYKVDLVQSILMAGTLVGAVIFGALADQFGRQKIWYITFTGLTIFGFASSFSPSYYTFTVLRFLTGLCIGGEILSAFVLATELIGPSYRGVAGTMAQCFFASGLLILPIMAYLIPDWRTLSVALSLPGSVFVLFFKAIFATANWLLRNCEGQFITRILTTSIIVHFLLDWLIVPESPRWLVIRGRLTEAEDILCEISLKNGIAVPKMLLQVNRPLASFGKKYGCLDLICSRKMAKIMFVLIYLWFVNSLVYYGLSLNIKNLGGDIYMNFFLSSVMEIPAYLTSVCLINWVGRRKSLCYNMLVGGIACLTCLFVQTGDGQLYQMLTTVFAMIGKFGIAASFAIIYIYSAELLPTVVRNVGMGVCSMSSRIGGICSPLVVYLGVYTRPLPMVIFGMCSFSAGLLSLALPETLNKPMPETLEEADLEAMPYQQIPMDGLKFVTDVTDDVFQANASDFDDELADEKTAFI